MSVFFSTWAFGPWGCHVRRVKLSSWWYVRGVYNITLFATYLRQADGHILANDVTDRRGPLPHLCFVLLCLRSFCGDLFIKLFLLCDEFVRILFRLIQVFSAYPSVIRQLRATFFLAAISFCTAFTCLLILLASKSTVSISR